MDSAYEEILQESSPKIRDLVGRTRALIHEVYPPIVEVPWVKQKIVGYGVGPKKNTEHFCYISVHKGHINLGFNYGSELPDPENLLQGTGKLFRHLRIKEPADLEPPSVRALLEAASNHRMPGREKPDEG